MTSPDTHPNAKGQQKIADLLITAGFAPILPYAADI